MAQQEVPTPPLAPPPPLKQQPHHHHPQPHTTATMPHDTIAEETIATVTEIVTAVHPATSKTDAAPHATIKITVTAAVPHAAIPTTSSSPPTKKSETGFKTVVQKESSANLSLTSSPLKNRWPWKNFKKLL
jgi:hypothetical protein